MNLNDEFKKLQEGQKLILQSLVGPTEAKNKPVKVYTLDELARVFSVTKRTIYNWKEEGRLSFVSVGSKTYVTSKQVNEFLERNSVNLIKNGRI